MSPRARRDWLLGLVALDILFFGGWIGRELYARGSGTEVFLPVRGYDPRDLLSGHYVRFRLVAEEEADALDPKGAAEAFCLSERDGRHHVTSVRTKTSPCATFLRVRAQRNGLRFGVDRFYIDERRAPEAAVLPPEADATLRARVDASGVLHIQDLLVKEKSLGGAGR